MSGSNKQRNRPERINSLGIQKPKLVQWWLESDKADFMIRMGLAVLAAVTLLAACQTWRPVCVSQARYPVLQPDHPRLLRS